MNQAVIDPWAYTAESPLCPWIPDARGSALACQQVLNVVDISNERILSLAEVLDIALMNNPQTQLTWAEARQAAAEYGKSQSTAFPEITGEFSYVRTRSAFLSNQVSLTQSTQQELIISTVSTWGPQANLTYTLFDFGQRRYTSQAARYSLYFANFTHNREIQNLVEAITIDYYNYLYQQKQLEANEADLLTTEETLKAANLDLEKGLKDISDVLQSRTQSLLAEIDLSEQRKAVKAAYSILVKDMGLPANIELKFQKLPFVDPEEIVLDPVEKYIEKAMSTRPDLLAARAQVQSAEASLTVAKRQWLPTVDYSLDFGRTYYSGGFRDDYDYVSTLTVSMPIFTGFWIRNNIKSAKAQVDQTMALLREKELEIIEEISTSHFNIKVAYDTLKAANNLLLAAQEQYKVARAKYRVGTNTILDLVSAQSALFEARAKQANGIKEWFIAFADLVYSMGIDYNEKF